MLHQRLAGRAPARPRPGRRDAPHRAPALLDEWWATPAEPPPDEPPSPPGWHESSFELRRGLEVREIFRQGLPGGCAGPAG